MELEEYLKHYSRSECIALNTLMEKGDGTLKNTMISLIQKHKIDENQASKSTMNFEKNCESEIDSQFQCLMEQVKELELSIGPFSPSSSLSKKSSKLSANSSDRPSTEKKTSIKRFTFGEETNR